ncbi:MAG: bifunctional demethylmenaquinone methyltransferase/2-methoxy-6-polyprenyl-1,4-benzoquinol methylase UbiE [Planctomycetaceae bacterium]|nr:bifunctional demethylmenaquinone methyltransferase/2-methoxy-6-polyprenyl-1,4-benzoquinol methylase UbiE [Planctomycetaceae bacterium]
MGKIVVERERTGVSPPVDKSPERIRRMFGSIAHRYDLINNILTLGIDRSWRKRAARQLMLEQTIGGDVLDVCCGTGELTLAFVKQQQKFATERTTYGIDFTPEMIDVASRKAKRYSAKRYSNMQFSVGDALSLPFGDHRFAVVAVAFGLRNLCDAQQGLVEMVRVCKPGGIVAVLDFSMPTLPIVRQCYQFYFRTLLPRLGQWFAKNPDRAYSYLPESVLQFDQPEQLAERLTHLGVANVQKKPMTFGIATLIWGEKRAVPEPQA